ncbi:SDR family oxidoreductase [Actinomadura sp. LD22]|uniref:SDR family oxidoreductase n=1 Tax=Actinomadura physcomitrii TaxID=2650748 RepID=A0A6I4MM34_9ACTN|nr:SDR family oxidoreductase [Actinomadura physcomitrii]MWA03276.1 SDR family oxidoreductase [Actinomadura physcomitrii]
MAGSESRFEGKRVVVTGAGALGPGLGNGRAAAVQYAREGARLVLVDRDPERIKDTVDEVRREGAECTTVICDVSTPEGVEAYVSHAMDALGGIDVLHCNVGIAADDTTTAMSMKRWRLVYRVNVESLMLACQAVIPQMRAGGGGAIVNISSIASIRSTGRPFPAYASSKAAANALIREVAIEGAPYGIRANTVVVGYVDTPTVAAAYADRMDEWDDFVAQRRRAIPRARQGTGLDVARAALFLASDQADFVTGTEVIVDGGMTRVSGGPLFEA